MLTLARVGRVFSESFIRRSFQHAAWGNCGAENTLWATATCLTEKDQERTRYAAQRAVYDRAAAELMDWAVANA